VEAVIADVRSRYGDLLRPEEAARLEAFEALPLPARRLYMRMLTRRGPWFREDDLVYSEIGPVGEPLQVLEAAGFCERQAECSELLPLLTKGDVCDLLGHFGQVAAKASRRGDLVERLVEGSDPAELEDALRAFLRPVRLLETELWHVVFFLFFGNGEQDLSSFVLADTGRLAFEPYTVDPADRLFETREDVDFLLSIRVLREALERADASGDSASIAELTALALAMEPHPGVRQQRRYHRLLNLLGQTWERADETSKALACFTQSHLPPARERVARLLAKIGQPGEACRQAMAMAEAPRDPGEERVARVFLGRQACRLPEAARWLEAHPSPDRVPELHLSLPRQASVEEATLEAARREGWAGFFAENHLWKALFGLAFWEVLFAPLRGAFQHRFQTAPADLGQPDFFERRRALFEARLAELADHEGPMPRILHTFDHKQGVANAFVAWKALRRVDLEAVLARVPPAILTSVLGTMASHPSAFSSGFPDLFLYEPGGQGWMLQEVKGPGDRLRPEQERWLLQFAHLGADVRVVYVTWEP
jgi:hypothetical protein